ncbi:protein-tyrosine phosphatase-like protein [Cristinia sonorae]|uniref:Protein-tyrosine phosphatase-like protein n=1 Tax=Cristinia sonorae TaxID=1940300 RepID=A0A8K0XND2_9AGAR|nr:protein-tyrosine phosphatase-like protein [Cristinia sonorae]
MDIEPLDPEFVRDRLSRPPFVTIAGVDNVRDLGSYPTSNPGFITKPNFILRGAEISAIQEEGKERLRQLGIVKAFDLRSDTEIAKWGTAPPAFEGFEIVRTPVFKIEDYSPEMMAKRFELYASGKTEAFMKLYSQILDNAGPAFGVIFRHVRDKPTEGCFIHCTAGKDRTGVLAALILTLAGVSDDAIADDYALTRVGREPARAKVMARLSKEPIFATNSEAALNMFSSRAETMLAFLHLLREKYGGVEEYLKQYVGLTDADIAAIRRNLLVAAT